MGISLSTQAAYELPGEEQAIAAFNRAMQVELQAGDASALLEQYARDGTIAASQRLPLGGQQ